MKLTIFILLFFSKNIAASDSISISFVVIDSLTQKPLEGAFIMHCGQVTSTNSFGVAQMTIDTQSTAKIFVFHLLGYDRKEIAISQFPIDRRQFIIDLWPIKYRRHRCRLLSKIDYVGERTR